MTHTELESRPVAESPLTGTPQISVVIPVYNEEATIEEVLRRTVEALESLARPYEVIVVDDGSSDSTWSIVERAHAREPRLRAVRFKRNFGQHPAMHAGLVRSRGDIVVTMDGDLQNSPADLPKLIAAVEAGSDVASGRRARAGRLVGADAAFPARQRDAPTLHPGARSPISAAPTTPTGARPSRPSSARSASRSSRRRSCSRRARA